MLCALQARTAMETCTGLISLQGEISDSERRMALALSATQMQSELVNNDGLHEVIEEVFCSHDAMWKLDSMQVTICVPAAASCVRVRARNVQQHSLSQAPWFERGGLNLRHIIHTATYRCIWVSHASLCQVSAIVEEVQARLDTPGVSDLESEQKVKNYACILPHLGYSTKLCLCF